MSEQRSRDTEYITGILISHQLLKGGICTCGYEYRLGESIQRHRAEKITEAGFRRV
jgi:hypothetical protein